MPKYTYICPQGHVEPIEEPMLYEGTRTCECGEEMWRKPSAPSVNWGGLSPSQGGISPLAKEMELGAPARRDLYQGMKEEREKSNS